MLGVPGAPILARHHLRHLLCSPELLGSRVIRPAQLVLTPFLFSSFKLVARRTACTAGVTVAYHLWGPGSKSRVHPGAEAPAPLFTAAPFLDCLTLPALSTCSSLTPAYFCGTHFPVQSPHQNLPTHSHRLFQV